MASFRAAEPCGTLVSVSARVHVLEGCFSVGGAANRGPHLGRTMAVLVGDDGGLVIVNSIRMADDSSLRSLGPVRHVVRLGSMHGCDDPYYVAEFGAQYHAFPGNAVTYGDLSSVARPLDAGSDLGIADLDVIPFAATLQTGRPEGALYMVRMCVCVRVCVPAHSFPTAVCVQPSDQVLVTTDAILNTSSYAHNSLLFKLLMCCSGGTREANIPASWLNAIGSLVPNHLDALWPTYRRLVVRWRWRCLPCCSRSELHEQAVVC